MRRIRIRLDRRTMRSDDGLVEYPWIEDIDTGKVQTFWEPGAPVMVNAVKDEDFHPHETHLRLVAALLPHKASGRL